MSQSGIPTPQELAKVSKLFEMLDEAGRQRLLESAERRRYAAGEVVCREGEPGDAFYVVLDGKVSITADDLGQERSVASLGKGGFFGEMAVLTQQPRSATVTVASDADILVFARPAVEEILRDYPLVRQVLGKIGVLRTEELFTRLSRDEPDDEQA